MLLLFKRSHAITGVIRCGVGDTQGATAYNGGKDIHPEEPGP